MKATPTKRTLDRLRKTGHIAQVVERWNERARVRQDLFGFVDVVAIHPAAKRILFVQATSHANVGARVRKIVTGCDGEALACVDAGAAVAAGQAGG